MSTKKLFLLVIVTIILLIGLGLGFVTFANFVVERFGAMLGFIMAISLFLLTILSGFLYDRRSKKANDKKKSDLLDTGKLIFQQYKEEFAGFYNLYLLDKKKFLAQKSAENFDLKTLRPVDVLYLFADTKSLVDLIDWRGEEDEKDIETFIETNFLKRKHTWAKTSGLRVGVSENKQRDGGFIVDLFKAVDKDLHTIGQRLLFFDLGWDAYAYTVVDHKLFDEIISNAPDEFHGAARLKK